MVWGFEALDFVEGRWEFMDEAARISHQQVGSLRKFLDLNGFLERYVSWLIIIIIMNDNNS